MLMCTFWGGGRGAGSDKVYVLYTHLNVGNYGRPLKDGKHFIMQIFSFILLAGTDVLIR